MHAERWDVQLWYSSDLRDAESLFLTLAAILILFPPAVAIDDRFECACGLQTLMHKSDRAELVLMSQSAPSSPLSTPTLPSHGGSRPGSGCKGGKKRQRNVITAAAREAGKTSLRHRQRLEAGYISLANAPGRQLSSNELRIIIRIAIRLQLDEDYTEAAAIEAASVWAGSSRHTVEPAYRHWYETDELVESDQSLRGRGNPAHPQHDTSLTLDQVLGIHSLIEEAKHKSEFMPARIIKQRLNLPIGLRQLQKVIKQLGYRWGRRRCIGSAGRKQQEQRMRSFIRQLAEALQQERDGTAIIGGTDESYLHTGHSNQYCYYSPASSARNQCRAKPSKGKRLIMLHVMTRHGLLTAPRRGRSAAAPSNVVSDEELGCELIFEGLVDSEDYHKNMNGQIFMEWIHNRLIPTFKRLHPGKKLILLLDNASYHHPRGPDWVNPNKLTKLQLAEWICERVDSITVKRNGVDKYFGKTALFQPASRYAPTVEEMRQWVKDYLLLHPTLNRTLLRQAFDAEGWQLIYTPPYWCECQPVELLWAYVKNYVGRMMSIDQSVDHVTQLARQGFYGDEANKHQGADADLCSRLFDHVYTWINNWIKNDSELTGTLQQLSDVFAPADDAFDDIDDEEEAQAMEICGGGWSEEESDDEE